MVNESYRINRTRGIGFMHWLRKIAGGSFVLYILWLLFNVIYGISEQLHMFMSEDFCLEYFKRVMYLYIGSWVSYILFLVSAYKCCLLYTSTWHP